MSIEALNVKKKTFGSALNLKEGKIIRYIYIYDITASPT